MKQYEVEADHGQSKRDARALQQQNHHCLWLTVMELLRRSLQENVHNFLSTLNTMGGTSDTKSIPVFCFTNHLLRGVLDEHLKGNAAYSCGLCFLKDHICFSDTNSGPIFCFTSHLGV